MAIVLSYATGKLTAFDNVTGKDFGVPGGKFLRIYSKNNTYVTFQSTDSLLYIVEPNLLISEYLNGDDGNAPFDAITLDAFLTAGGFFLDGLTGAKAVISENFGFFDYNDADTQVNNVALLDGVWTDVPNDGAGAFTNTAYKPSTVNTLLDTNTGYLDFTELTLGSTVLVRIDFIVSPQVNNSVLECRYELGDGLGLYALEVFRQRLDQGSGIVYPSQKQSFYIYMGDSNTLDNPAKLQVRLVGSDGALINNGVAIEVRKQ